MSFITSASAILIQVSSVHGHGTGDLLDAVLEHLPEEKEEEDEGEIIKVAVIGKPNVGKSFPL